MDNTPFHSLSLDEQRDAIGFAAGESGRPPHLLEKDIWVVQILQNLFATEYGGALTFKGGTSLSKAYNAIRRFSEDIDITYDIRAIAADLVEKNNGSPIPPTTSQARKWTNQIRERLAEWVSCEMAPAIASQLDEAGLAAEVKVEVIEDKIVVSYEPLFSGGGYVRPEVLLEFGARATGEPREERFIECDAAVHIQDVEFPTARPWVMSVERTFWEKATAIHVFCRQRRSLPSRLSRHWHDIVRLDDAGYADRALANRHEALRVAKHKGMFFREKDTDDNWIDYKAAVSGSLQLVPEGPAYQVVESDYERMVEDGILLDDSEGFNDLMRRCSELEEKANQT